MAGKGGGAWKVAYADFVTAMMAFFLVMWITSQSKPAKQAIAKYFNDPFMMTSDSPGGALSLTKGDGELPMMLGPKIGLAAPPYPLADQSRKQREGTPGGAPQKPGLLVLHDGNRQITGTVIQFAEHSAELSEVAKQRLRGVVPMLRGKRNKIEVRGHATRRPLPPESPFHDGWQLCYARCLAVTEFLEQNGIERERIRLSQAGPYEPYTIRVESEMQSQNSRVEVYVLPERVEDLVGTPQERAERLKTP